MAKVNIILEYSNSTTVGMD